MTDRIAVVGPVPPPVDGRAVSTEWLIEAMRRRTPRLSITDTQLDGRLRPIRKALRCLAAAADVLRSPAELMVVIASGGLGVIGEALPLVAARWRRCPALLIHHSSSYVRNRSPLMALVIRLGGPHLRHVLLGLEMRAAFASEYRLDLDRCLLLDNAALMPIPKPSKSDSPRGILHLANLSAAKGSLIVLEVASLLGSPMDAPLVRFAGPADSEVKIAIDGARDRGVGVTLTGPVYGDRKRAELESARVLLFPSYYDHEAQPLVVYEAAALGTVPIVWSAGWIAEQMANLGLSRYVFPVGEIGGLVSAAREVLSLSEEEFERLSGEVRRAFSSLQARCQPMLEAILGAEHEE